MSLNQAYDIASHSVDEKDEEKKLQQQMQQQHKQEFEQEQRQRWLQHPYTKQLLQTLHDLSEGARNVSENYALTDNPASDITIRKLLIGSNTLKKVIHYVQTGKYPETNA